MESLKSVLPLDVTYVEPKRNCANICYADGDLCAIVYGNIAAMPDPISAKEMADYMVTAVNTRQALVDALKAIRDHIVFEGFTNPVLIARAALKQAGEL